MTSPQVPPRGSTWTPAFPFLFVLAWACCGALVRWEARWLYLLLGLAVIGALLVGRRQPAFLRVLLVLALVFPAWKKINHWRDRIAARKDAALITALVTSEE